MFNLLDYRKKYYQENKEYLKKKSREYWYKTKDIQKEKKKLYYKKNWNKIREKRLKHYKENREYYRNYDKKYKLSHKYELQLKQKYLSFGITKDQYENLLRVQNYCCALCGIPQKNLKRVLAVDHNHATGKIRGLLCSKCNTGIGLLGDSVGRLSKAIDYLQGSNEYAAG